MEKCRICLSVKRKVQSIFDSNKNNGYSFAFMMMSVAHIKIVGNEGITEVICWRCSQKLIEAYNLKVLIERSDDILRNSAGFKRINFTNLQDKIQMEIDTSKEIPQQCYNDIADSLKNGQSSLVFKNITIQKIEADDIKIKKESEPLSVVEFLNSFKPEESASYHDDDDDDFHQCDDHYSPQLDNEDPKYNLRLSMRKSKGKKRNAKMKDESSGFKPDDDASSHDDDFHQCDDHYSPQLDNEDPKYNLRLSMRKSKGKKRNAKMKDESSGFKPDDDASSHDDDFHQCDDHYSPQLDNEDPKYNLRLSMRKSKGKKRNAKMKDESSGFKPDDDASSHDDDFHQCDDHYSPQLDNEDPKYNLRLSMRKSKGKKRNAKMKDESSGFKPDDDASSHDDNFDHDQCDDDYTPQSDYEDPDYNLPLTTRKQESKRIYKKRHPKKKDESSVTDNVEFKKIHIKPVILKDVQVLPAIPRKTKERTKKKPEVKRYMCNYCGKMITSKEHLLTHTGEKSKKCDICSKAFLTLSGLLNHKKAHIQEKNFKCDKCVAAFTTAASLKSHYVMHLDENKFVCDTCSKSFKRRGALRRHKLIHNVANKCINCDLCNMSFFTKYSLRHHLRIHTGERPYKCEICSQPYSYKRDFNRHCLKKHGVFIDRRAVYVMNEEVLQRERALMRDLVLKMQGVTSDDEPLKAFEGPQGALAFEMAIKALKSKNIPID